MKIGLIGSLIAFSIIVLSGVIGTYIGLRKSKDPKTLVLTIKILTFLWITINFILILLIILIRP